MAVPGGNPQPLEPLGGKGEGRAVLAKADILEEFESLPAADVQAGLTSQIDFKAGACGPILHGAGAVRVDRGAEGRPDGPARAALGSQKIAGKVLGRTDAQGGKKPELRAEVRAAVVVVTEKNKTGRSQD